MGNNLIVDALNLCARDPCCMQGCTLIGGEVFGSCCKYCQIMPTGTVYREEDNECNLPEWYNGCCLCPQWEPLHYGGYCYEKKCNGNDEQCGQTSDREARIAGEIDYSKIYNVTVLVTVLSSEIHT